MIEIDPCHIQGLLSTNSWRSNKLAQFLIDTYLGVYTPEI